MEANIYINNTDMESSNTGISNSKLLLYIGIASIVMLFAGLTSAYIVRQAEGNWLEFELPTMFYFSTAIIVISSFFMQWAINMAKKGDGEKTNIALWSTLALGCLFICLQYLGWMELYKKGVFFAGIQANASGSFMYAITGLHIAHLLGGIVYLLILNIKYLLNSDTALVYEKADVFKIYWHFLGILWVYLLVFLVFIG